MSALIPAVYDLRVIENLDDSLPRHLKQLFNFIDYSKGKLPAGKFYFLLRFCDGPADRTVPADILDAIRQKRCKILGFNRHRNVTYTERQRWIEEVQRVNPGISEPDIRLMMPGPQEAGNISYCDWREHMVAQCSDRYTDITDRAAADIIRRTPRTNKFICLNWRAMPHRAIAATMLFDYRDQGILTYRNWAASHSRAIDNNVEHAMYKSLPDVFVKFQEVKEHLPLVWDVQEDEPAPDRIGAANINEYEARGILDTYLSVVTESVYDGTDMPTWFTEKSFKPMMFMQPFVLLSVQGALNELRRQGFKTFHEWIDESYDNIEDNELRVKTALDAAIRFFTRSHEELTHDLAEMLPVLEHNRRHLLDEHHAGPYRVYEILCQDIELSPNERNSGNIKLLFDPLLRYHNRRGPQDRSPRGPTFRYKEFQNEFDIYAIDRIELPNEPFYYLLDQDILDKAHYCVENTAGDDEIENYTRRFYSRANRNLFASVVERVKSGQAKFLIDYNGYWRMEQFKKMISALAKLIDPELGQDHFIFLTYSDTTTPSVRTANFNVWEHEIVTHFGNKHKAFTAEATEKIKQKTLRKNKFICLNGRPTFSRLMTVHHMFDFRDQGILTCDVSSDISNIHVPDASGKSSRDRIMNVVGTTDAVVAYRFEKEILPKLPLKWDVDETQFPRPNATLVEVYDYQRVLGIERPYVEQYLDTYLNIVTETDFYADDHIKFSEKIYKPMLTMMPFVLVGQPNMLPLLKSWGFKTFDQWIDESYDQIENPLLRVFAACEAAKEFINRPAEELSEILLEMLPILSHNRYLALYRGRNMWGRFGVQLKYWLQ